jgi:hypothetical protein
LAERTPLISAAERSSRAFVADEEPGVSKLVSVKLS